MKMILKPLFALILILNFTSFSQAMDLNEARKSKKVIELPTGFLEAADPSAKTFVDEINAKRKKAYEDVAEKTKTSSDVVGARAHQKIMKDLNEK